MTPRVQALLDAGAQIMANVEQHTTVIKRDDGRFAILVVHCRDCAHAIDGTADMIEQSGRTKVERLYTFAAQGKKQ